MFMDVNKYNGEAKYQMKKIGRNDPCPCGSGKKYKKCCLNKADNPVYSDIANLKMIYKESRKAARFKECI